MVMNEQMRTLEVMVMAYLNELSRHLSKEPEENYEMSGYPVIW
jgi:hypothetical protein